MRSKKEFADAEATLRTVLEKPAAWKELNPILLPLALRSLAVGYRNEEKFAEAEPHLVKLVPLVLVNPGETAVQARVDMFMLADTYANLRKYPEAEKVFRQVLDIQRRVVGPEAINTVVTVSNVGWIQFQQKQFADAEKTLREAAAILVRTAPNAWERFNVEHAWSKPCSAKEV